MMKKNYQKPAMQIVEIETARFIANSVTGVNSGDAGIGYGGGGDGEARSREGGGMWGWME